MIDIKQVPQLRSLVKEEGILELSLEGVDIPKPSDDEVVVRMEAVPINPSNVLVFFVIRLLPEKVSASSITWAMLKTH